jgi:hypothetical protein
MFILPNAVIVSAQSVITGNIKNKNGDTLSAIITVQAKGSVTVAGFTSTDANGNYTLKYAGTADSIVITATGMNIGKHNKTVVNSTQKVDFVIDEKPLELKEVTATAPKIKLRGDTLDYSVNAYIDRNDRIIGDVLKKMPGIEVAQNGRISYQGKEISKFYVENLDLLQGRYGIATNNIPAKDVTTVQVMENHQPIKALRDKVISDAAAINLKLKDSAKGSLSLSGLAGAGYRPVLWNAELVSMYFAKTMQNMNVYKSNNSGDDVASEFRIHYDYERVYMDVGSMMSIHSPTTPPIPQKRYLYNNSHAVTANQLFKLNDNIDLTVNTLYYNDRTEKEGYSLYEQYLPGDSLLTVEEHVHSSSKIHNAEVALRLNNNAADYYLNNALNLSGNWNSDEGMGLTRSNASNIDETIRQYLEKPSFSIDNTLNLIKNIKNNSYKIYFSTGYGARPHTLTVTPAGYFGNDTLAALSQEIISRDFSSALRISYGIKLGYFNLDYALWGRVDIRNMETDLQGERYNGRIHLSDSLKNNLRYDTYQTGIHQNYMFDNGRFKAGAQLPLTRYVMSIKNHIPQNSARHNKWLVNPSFFAKYDIIPELTASVGAGFNRSYGDINSSYTGYIMHNYRHLLRNSIDRLFESRSSGGNISFRYKNIFEALFINGGFKYDRSWKNMLYGYNYQGIMNVKTTTDQPTESSGYDVSVNASKGLDFWSATIRIFGGYNENTGELLIQDEILN